jgi:hypothetical protein
MYHNRGGRIEVLRNGYIATGFIGGRTPSIADSWRSIDAESRGNDSLGIGGGGQNKEEYGSSERLGEHLDK